MTHVPVFDNLTFDAGPHIYRLDGREIPSVTTIMKPLSDAKYGSIPSNVLEKAADRGTAVHQAIEDYIKYGFADIDSEYHGYLNAFEKWNEEYHPSFITSEMFVYHPLMQYAGTLDILAEITGQTYLIDTKTTSEIIEKSCRIQLEAYNQALSAHGIHIDGKAILNLRNDGSFEFRIFNLKDAEAWRIFGSLKNVYDYLRS